MSIVQRINAAFAEGNKEIEIRLEHSGMTDAQFNYLAGKKENCKSNQKVVALFIIGNQLGDFSMYRMTDRKWESLTRLQLGCNRIGDRGCQFLSMVKIPQIQKITLNDNGISSLGVSHLIKSKWKRIRQISLDGNRLGVSAVKEISKADWLKTIKELCIHCNELTEGQIHKLVLCDMPNVDCLWAVKNKIEKQRHNKLRFILILKLASAQLICL